MKPPFEITAEAALLLARLERVLGRYEGALVAPASPMLRKSAKVKTVHATLAIEGNHLTEGQVTALLEGKRVIAPARDLREVQNALSAHEKMGRWKPFRVSHFLAAHGLMMRGLVKRPGSWRSRAVGIAKGKDLTHVAPPADRVPGLVKSLFAWMKEASSVPIPIRAAVFHYEIEFIHPFEDGNGRMGRLWHSLMLCEYHPVFSGVSIETEIRKRQDAYYRVLNACDRAGSSTAFVEFALEVTLHALEALTAPKVKMKAADRLDAARLHFGSERFARTDYLQQFPSLSTATASRDLQHGVEKKILRREGDKAGAQYHFL